jgi:hypothetical protein
MSEVWTALVGIQEELTKSFEQSGIEVFEPGMAKFNQPGWTNRVWTGEKYRRAHIDVVDARETKGLWMMHCCIFPHLHNNGPIFGLDVIAGKNKITGFFHDYSATIDPMHDMIDAFGDEAAALEWKKKRALPEWAQAIFSEHMIAAGNVQKPDELEQIVQLSTDSIFAYLDLIGEYNFAGDQDEIKSAQNKYAYHQKQNPHTPKTMTSLGLSEDDVTTFVQECLFPEVE